MRLVGPRGRPGRVRKALSIPGFESRTTQPMASSFAVNTQLTVITVRLSTLCVTGLVIWLVHLHDPDCGITVRVRCVRDSVFSCVVAASLRTLDMCESVSGVLFGVRVCVCFGVDGMLRHRWWWRISNHVAVTRSRVGTSLVHVIECPRDGLSKLLAVRCPQLRWWRSRALGCSALWRGGAAAGSDQPWLSDKVRTLYYRQLRNVLFRRVC